MDPGLMSFRALATPWLLLASLVAGCGTAPEADTATVGDLGSGADSLLDELAPDVATDTLGEPTDAAVAQDSVPAADSAPAPDSAPDADADAAVVDAGCTAPGCPCTTNGQCDSAFCIETNGGQQCAKLCTGACADGFKCGQISGSGGDIVNLCVPMHPRLCQPCQADSDCNNVLGGAESRCVPYKDGSGSLVGAFCGNSCSDGGGGCPGGFSCKQATSLGGIKGSQCVKDDLVCPCDARATKLALTTVCTQANPVGTCGGKRSCGASGLSACDAPAAVTEQCNQKDDDCDSQTDEPSAGMCDDGAQCTYDNCVGGACQHPPLTGACNDDSACTSGDGCNNGVCVGKAVLCDDKNPCMLDTCDATKGCGATADDSGACTDGSVCTVGDACKGGACLPGAVTACDDGNPCTNDGCDAKSGCTFAINALPCSDGDSCTLGDGCKGGVCATTAKLPCSDGNPCTTDSCEPINGCKFQNNTLGCSDNNTCTENDACVDGTCLPGTAKACDDGNPCTADACDAKKGCTAVANVLPCQDNNLCTDGDQCKDGACVPGKAKACDDGNVCTNDLCDAIKGCLPVSNADACTDSNVCTEGDQCQGGKCQPGKGKVCNDGDPCTDDSCHPQKGCVTANNSAACSDNNVCTINDTCVQGACAGAGVSNCDDGNGCTDDACQKGNGCKHFANTSGCSDGSVCTLNDSCAATVCKAGSVKGCDDGEPCTADTCNAQQGCLYASISAGCDDGNACTIKDACSQGKCAGGAAVNCDDGNGCTADSCAAVGGCGYAANTAGCSDGDGCTVGDICAAKACKAGALTDADGDGFGPVSCGGKDCDDGKFAVNPGVVESCATVGVDDNCNGQVNEGCGCAKAGFALPGCTACLDNYLLVNSNPGDVCAPDGPVWGPQALSPNTFTDNGDGTVSDSLTKRMWQKGFSAGVMDWGKAKTYCLTQTTGGKNDWRLPTQAELDTNVDFTKVNPAAAVAFAGAPGEWFWSATAYSGSSSNAWVVNFNYGSSGYVFITGTSRVRCVR